MPEVAHSFASALWSLDVLFEMARVGVDGVNLHTFPGATYQLFTFSRAHGRWRGEATGLPVGPRRTSMLRPTRHRYLVRVPAASAAVLTLPAG